MDCMAGCWCFVCSIAWCGENGVKEWTDIKDVHYTIGKSARKFHSNLCAAGFF
jgi:hypothetical protein